MHLSAVLPTPRGSLVMTTLVACAALAGVASATDYEATLDGAQAVPPSSSTASGSATLTLDASNVLHYNITFQGLQGTEIAAHIHGPGDYGQDADVVTFLPSGSPKIGTYGPLLPYELTDLDNELWYINIHSTLFNNGEIRGQILKVANVGVGPDGQPDRLRIARIQPNPSRGHSVVTLSLPVSGTARLRIFDVHGRLVRTLLDGPVQAGVQSLAWDGLDERGGAAGGGIYFLQLESGGRTAQARTVILR